MTLTNADKKYIDAVIYRAGAHCLDMLAKRCQELIKETNSDASREVVESGAKTVYRFEAYLRKHLEIDMKEGEEVWLTK
jgi:hypothetical protein